MYAIPGPLPPISIAPSSVRQWAEQRLKDHCLPRLDLAQRQTLMGLVAQAGATEEPYDDDPVSAGAHLEWAPAWRPAPAAGWLPCEVPDLPWTFWWTQTVEGAEIWYDEQRIHEGWYEDWYDTPPSVRVIGQRVRLWHACASIELYSRYARVDYDDDEGLFEGGWATIEALVGLTGWVLYDELNHRICAHGAGCGDCGFTFWLDQYGEHRMTDTASPAPPECCPRCFSAALVFVAPPARELAPPLSHEASARRLLDALLDCGGLETSDEVALLQSLEGALIAAVSPDAPPPDRAARLAVALLASRVVAELHLSDKQLTGLLAAW